MPKCGYFYQSLFSLLPLRLDESFRIHLEASGKSSFVAIRKCWLLTANSIKIGFTIILIDVLLRPDYDETS